MKYKFITYEFEAVQWVDQPVEELPLWLIRKGVYLNRGKDNSYTEDCLFVGGIPGIHKDVSSFGNGDYIWLNSEGKVVGMEKERFERWYEPVTIPHIQV